MDTYQKLVRPNPAHDFIFQKISAHGLGLTQPTRTPVLLLVSQLLGSKHLRIRIQPSFALNSGPVPKKVILQLPILHKYNDEGIFMCIPPPLTLSHLFNGVLSQIQHQNVLFPHQYFQKSVCKKIFRFLSDVGHYFNQPH
jgi:hypothetical protein